MKNGIPLPLSGAFWKKVRSIELWFLVHYYFMFCELM